MVNKVILIGNVGMDPEVRTTESGVKVARVRLATSERIFDRQANETREHTEWHTVTLWRGLADVVDRYVRKGSQIYIEGRLRTRDWLDKDNNKRFTTEILADTMNLLGRRGDSPASDGTFGQASASAPYAQAAASPASVPGQSADAQAAAQSGAGYALSAAPSASSAAQSVAQSVGSQAPAAAPYSQPTASPASAPAMPAEDPDDLPF